MRPGFRISDLTLRKRHLKALLVKILYYGLRRSIQTRVGIRATSPGKDVASGRTLRTRIVDPRNNSHYEFGTPGLSELSLRY
jgi:hypothetical protein